jgi:hypothetical protein
VEPLFNVGVILFAVLVYIFGLIIYTVSIADLVYVCYKQIGAFDVFTLGTFGLGLVVPPDITDPR